MSTSTYEYNTEGQRVSVTVGTTTTYYPNKNYSVSNGVPTKHIFLGDELISTIYSSSTQAIPYYIHTDHLGSTNVVTNASSTIAELTDYYTYGSPRISQKSGSFVEKRKYIGEDYDKETNLSYLNARYYDGQRGQFISQDPVFIYMGNNAEIRERYDVDMIMLLSDPQQLNSYSYARNNPIIYKDPTGNLTWSAIWDDPVGSIVTAAGWGAASIGVNIINKPFTADLLRHSASLSPSDLSIDVGNQKQYGNVIDSIKETSQYKEFINHAVENAKNGQNVTLGSVQFDKGDLYTSLHRANIEVNVEQIENGWNTNTTITDKYDFNQTNPQTYKGSVTRIPAMQAYKDQQKGVLSNYNIKIKINDKIK